MRTYYSIMSQRSLREDILNAGLKVMFRSGYIGASVRDICAAAGAPQGSFTNHFRSKEAFAQEVLDRYFADLKIVVSKALNDKSLSTSAGSKYQTKQPFSYRSIFLRQQQRGDGSIRFGDDPEFFGVCYRIAAHQPEAILQA